MGKRDAHGDGMVRVIVFAKGCEKLLTVLVALLLRRQTIWRRCSAIEIVDITTSEERGCFSNLSLGFEKEGGGNRVRLTGRKCTHPEVPGPRNASRMPCQ